jgi:hypothetical protein
MPITTQQIIDLKNQLSALKKDISLAENDFNTAIARNTLWHIDKSKLPSFKGAKMYFLDNVLLDYIQYDEDGNFMSASFDYSRKTYQTIYETPINEGPPYFYCIEFYIELTNGNVIIVDSIFLQFLGISISNINTKYALLQTAKQNLQDFLDNTNI